MLGRGGFGLSRKNDEITSSTGIARVFLYASRAEAVLASGGVVEFVDFSDGGVGDGGDDELGDAVLVIDGEGFFAQVNQGDEEFASVVGVDGARGVGETDAVLCGDA